MIYFLQAEDTKYIKIGFTARDDADFRRSECQTGNGSRLRLLGTMPGTLDDEKSLLMRFAAYRTDGGEEWFKPVAELLALINPIEVKECGGVEIAERAVTIRVLTVGRKQFTKSLLWQLPEGLVFDWLGAIEYRQASDYEVDDAELKQFVLGDIWGWVKGEHGCVNNINGGIADMDGTDRWVIFERDRTLFRCRDYIDDKCIYHHVKRSSDDYGDIVVVNKVRLLLPGFRPEDQLFIGV